MEKQTKRAFGKEIYLLGVNEEGRKVWLEKESWDCGWYWGYGYLETYTNNNSPERSRDIGSHTHFVNFETDKKNLFRLNEYHVLVKSTLDSDEMKKLKELMSKFKDLKEESGKEHRKNEKRYNEINRGLLPKLFNDVRKILTIENEND